MSYESTFLIFVQLNSFEKVNKKLGFATNAIEFKPWLPFIYCTQLLWHTRSADFWDGYATFRNAVSLFHKNLGKIESEKINYSVRAY